MIATEQVQRNVLQMTSEQLARVPVQNLARDSEKIARDCATQLHIPEAQVPINYILTYIQEFPEHMIGIIPSIKKVQGLERRRRPNDINFTNPWITIGIFQPVGTEDSDDIVDLVHDFHNMTDQIGIRSRVWIGPSIPRSTRTLHSDSLFDFAAWLRYEMRQGEIEKTVGIYFAK